MRSSLRTAAFLVLLSPILLHAQATRTPVLVELFTSEGCSSCPPADRLLATLAQRQPVSNAEIIAIEEHVDYWENIGWHDRFSSSIFTTRQNLYGPRLGFDSPYTPQMVVDGSYQFVGNDPSKALSAITKAIEITKIPLDISTPSIKGHIVSSSVASTTKQLPHGDLYAALIEPAASTEVRSGENGGRHLDHVNVVRTFQRIGHLQDMNNGPVAFSIAAPPTVSSNRMRLVVFAQLPGQGAIRGIASIATAP
jgi:hypothetical protein